MKRKVSQSSLQKIFTDGCSYYFSLPLRIMTKQVAGTAAVAKGEADHGHLQRRMHMEVPNNFWFG